VGWRGGARALYKGQQGVLDIILIKNSWENGRGIILKYDVKV